VGAEAASPSATVTLVVAGQFADPIPGCSRTGVLPVTDVGELSVERAPVACTLSPLITITLDHDHP
jgi:hypothetical protein